MNDLVRTTSAHSDFVMLVKLLDADLAMRDGAEHSFYAAFNTIDTIRHTVVAFENNKPVGCGAIKEFDSESMEVKRMFVLPEGRQKGTASKILGELEQWALHTLYTGNRKEATGSNRFISKAWLPYHSELRPVCRS